MSEEQVIPAFIMLDLSENASDELKQFLEDNEVTIISQEQYSSESVLSYILVNGDEDFSVINKDYGCLEKDISMASLGEIMDIHLFLRYNGKLVLNEKWIGNAVGETIIRRFLQAAGSVHIDESLSSHFTTQNSFKVINHLRMGYYGDTLAIDAFDNDFNLVALRGFLYNITYYLTYLKQAGISGVPFEVEYAVNDDMFMINIHANVSNFVSEYLVDSFGDENSKDSLQFLLKSSYKLADFFEITHINNPSKIVFTGVWEKARSSFFNGYSSLSVNNILTTKQLQAVVEEEIDQIQAKANGKSADEQVLDYSIKEEELEGKRLPGSWIDMYAPSNEESIFYEDPNLAGDLVEHVLAKFELDNPDKHISTMTADDLIYTIKGHNSDDEILQRIDQEDISFLLNKVKKSELSSSHEIALNSKRDELTCNDYLEEYRKEIKFEVCLRAKNNEKIEVEESALTTKMEEVTRELVNDDLELFKSSKSVAREMAEKIFIYVKGTVKLGLKELEEEIYQALSAVKRREREQLTSMLSRSSNDSESGGLSQREEVLLGKLKKNEKEVDELRRKLRASLIAIGSAKKVEQEKIQIQQKVQAEINKMELGDTTEGSQFSDSAELANKREQILNSIESGNLSDLETSEMASMVERERDLLEKGKVLELKLRKSEIESSQKEALYEQQLATKERLLRAKETAVSKVKENIKIITAKKDKEIKGIAQRFRSLTSQLNKLKASNNDVKIQSLQKENVLSKKNVEVLKKKIDSMRENFKDTQDQDKSAEISEELRKSQREAKALAVKAQTVEKENELYKRKLKEGEEKIKEFAQQNKKLTDSVTTKGNAALDRADEEELAKLKADALEKDKLMKVLVLKLKNSEMLIKKDQQTKTQLNTPASAENPEVKRMKTQLDRLEKDRIKMIEDSRKLKKDSMEAVTSYKKLKAEAKGQENRLNIMERENEKLKQKTAELIKKQQAAQKSNKAA
jgi:hypothetical protein